MSIIIGILTVLEVIVCLLLCLLVLMQRPRQEGLGATFGAGMMDQFAGAQTTNVLQRGTVYFGVALFGLTFLLAVLTSRMDAHKAGAKLVDPADLKEKPAATAPAVPTPAPVPAPASAGKDATPAPAKSEPAKPAADAKPVESKPADAKPAAAPAPKPEAAAKPAPVPAPTPSPAPAAETPEKK